jgi:hypothetical protein
MALKKTVISFFILLSNLLFCQSAQWITFNTVNSRLPNRSIYSVAVDKQGVKWFGTDGSGLVKFDGTQWSTYNAANSNLKCNLIRVIYVDEDNNKWIGTTCGGLHKFDGTYWTNWDTSNSKLPSQWVASFVIDRKGVKWIGTGDKGLVKMDGDSMTVYNTTNSPLPVNNIYALAADTLGNLWIGTNGGGTVKYDGTTWINFNKHNSGLHCNASLAIAIDNNNDKWIGSYTCGIFKMHDYTFTEYDSTNTPLPDNWVYSVTIDKKQAKWIGLDSAGVAKFEGSQWTIYDTANSGLADKHVRSIAVDELGNKWIATYLGGVSVFNENGVNIPSLIVVSLPSGTTNWITGSRQRITWSTGNITGNVNIKLSTDGGSSFPVTLISNTPNDGGENVIAPDIISSSCMIKIESISSSGIYGVSSGKFSIVKMVKPAQLKPLDGAVEQPVALTLFWNKGAWCEKYKIVLSSDSLFLNPVLQDSSLTDTLKKISGLNDFRKYYWKIQGLGSGIRTEWSPTWNFKTVFNAPDNLKAAASVKSSIKLTWRDNSSSETGYVIERKSGSVFIAIDTALANATTYVDSSPKAAGNYEYRLRAVANNGSSAYSNTATATLTAVNVPGEVLTDFMLEHNYPNPFNPATTIRYFLPEQSDVKLIIYDVKGMVIKTFELNSQSAGYQNIIWDGKNSNNEQVSSGTYICKLKAVTVNGKQYEKNLKMMLLK